MKRPIASPRCIFPILYRMPILLLLVAGCLVGCKTSRNIETPIGTENQYLSSKVKLTIPTKSAIYTVTGTLKLISGEQLQLSFLMPIFRTEVARIDVTPEELLLVDRMGKRYVYTNREELQKILPKKANFAALEKILFTAYTDEKARILTGADLGIADLEKGKIELSEFSTEPFTLTPTKLSSRYKKVELNELLSMLLSL